MLKRSYDRKNSMIYTACLFCILFDVFALGLVALLAVAGYSGVAVVVAIMGALLTPSIKLADSPKEHNDAT